MQGDERRLRAASKTESSVVGLEGLVPILERSKSSVERSCLREAGQCGSSKGESPTESWQHDEITGDWDLDEWGGQWESTGSTSALVSPFIFIW